MKLSLTPALGFSAPAPSSGSKPEGTASVLRSRPKAKGQKHGVAKAVVRPVGVSPDREPAIGDVG